MACCNFRKIDCASPIGASPFHTAPFALPGSARSIGPFKKSGRYLGHRITCDLTGPTVHSNEPEPHQRAKSLSRGYRPSLMTSKKMISAATSGCSSSAHRRCNESSKNSYSSVFRYDRRSLLWSGSSWKVGMSGCPVSIPSAKASARSSTG